MGHEVLYCGKCRTQLRGVQFEKGAAVRVGGQAYCSACAPKEAVAPERPEVADAAPLSTATPRAGQRTVPPAPRSGLLPFLLAGAGALFLLIAIAAVAGGKKPPSPPRPSPVEAAVSAPEAEPPPPERRPEAVREEPRRTAPQPKEAADAMAAEAAVIESQARAACREENFKQAFEILEQARRRHSEPEWAGRMDRLLREATRELETLFARLRTEAVEHRRRGQAEKVREAQDRVAKWGFDRYRSELEKALPGVVPEAPVPPAEHLAYRKQWEAAMLAAGSRNYAPAMAELKKAHSALREDPLRAEAAADVETVRAVEAMTAEALQAVVKGPKGRKLSLSTFDEAGSPRKVEGTLLRVDAQRLEVKTSEGPVRVEFGELVPSSVAEMFLARPQKKPATDGRTAAIFCLLEGDLDAARKLAAEGVPDRYWAQGAKAAERRARPDDREVEARKLFHAAEAEVGTFSTTAQAVGKYAVLLKDFADTSFVRRNRPSIDSRSGMGKEFFFYPEDLSGGGSFQLAKAAKLEACWTSLAEPPTDRMKENFVELAFSVLPKAEYRCWVYAGGCCGETLTCHAQVTGLSAVHPKTKEPTVAEPGADFWVPLKHVISTTARLHQSHGGPKQPVRWGWVAVPLPKFGTPGAKKVRVLTDQQGFAVAYALVSAVKAAPPKEPELKELEKERAERWGERTLAPPDATLVAHWKFDEKAGAVAFDASGRGNNASLVNAPSWTVGKAGGAVAFDGVDDYANVPHSATLDLGAEGQSYSISVWYRRTGAPASSRTIVNKNDGEGPYPFDLSVNPKGQPSFVLWDGNAAGQTPALSAQVVTDGAWHHLVAVRDAGAKMLRLYVDGTEAPTVNDVTRAGIKNTDGVWMARTEANKNFYHDAIALDDVRVYVRALGAAEVQALAAGRPR